MISAIEDSIPMPAIEVRDLAKKFRVRKKDDVQALKGISLAVARGEVFGFLGPNGAGKSTTIKILTGQIQPAGGQAKIFGVPTASPAARLRVGYLPENPAFYDFMTAREYLRFVGRTFGMENDDIEGAAVAVLAQLDLAGAADRPMRGFSKGMVQRLGLAQALLHDPDLFILDEPMSGLDPIGRALVKNIIKDLKLRGKTVFFSTHITADVEVVCDRVGVIVGGNLMAVDRVENILHQGVLGYVIQVKTPSGETEERLASKENLKESLERILASGAAIERIEPKGQDLEAFFLNIVAKARHESP